MVHSFVEAGELVTSNVKYFFHPAHFYISKNCGTLYRDLDFKTKIIENRSRCVFIFQFVRFLVVSMSKSRSTEMTNYASHRRAGATFKTQ